MTKFQNETHCLEMAIFHIVDFIIPLFLKEQLVVGLLEFEEILTWILTKERVFVIKVDYIEIEHLFEVSLIEEQL